MVVSGRRYLFGILSIAFLLLAAVVTISSNAEPANAADTEGTICAVVTDADTTDPIAGSYVDYTATSNGSYLGNEVSDATGRACLTIQGDLLEIDVRAEGSDIYLEKTATATLLAGQTVDVPVALETVKPGSISGVVTAVGSGSPLPGIEVFAASYDGDFESTTGADGTYTLTDLPKSYYEIRFSDPSLVYGTQWYNDGLYATESILVDGTGAAVAGVDAELDPAGSISGTIVDEATGSPIEGIKVDVYPGSPYVTRTSNALTDAAGEYTVGGLGTGDHYVSFGSPTYRWEYWNNASYGGVAAAIAVAAGSATTHIDAALVAVAAISGRVYDDRTGEGIPLTVSTSGVVGTNPDEYDRDSQTDASGYYILNNLVPGTWTFTAGWGDYIDPPDTYSRFFRADAPCGTPPPIVLGVGEWVDGVDFVLRAFCDVESGRWYFNSVEAVAAAGIADGRPDGSFGPNDTMTRAEMAAFMVKALGETPTTPTEEPFPDVPLGKWYTGYIDKAKELGLTVGKPDGSYAPEDNVTRGETAAFLYRAKEGAVPPDKPTVEPFPDVPVTKWHAGYIDWMKQADYTTGRPDGTYGPEDSITRAEMATFLERIYIP